jgi:hypothetical protein
VKIIAYTAAALAGLALLILATVIITREILRWRAWKRKEVSA